MSRWQSITSEYRLSTLVISNYRITILESLRLRRIKKLPIGAACVQMLFGSLPAYLLAVTALTRGVISIIIMEAIIIPIIRVKNRIAFILCIVYGIVGVVVKWGIIKTLGL